MSITHSCTITIEKRGRHDNFDISHCRYDVSHPCQNPNPAFSCWAASSSPARHSKPLTLLCTFDITDLYTMLLQEESLDILTKFLLNNGYCKVRCVPLDAIRKLARLVLIENAFIYDGKYYKQIIGSPMGSPFTLTLANIYMWH
jgi:hypothetical protein